MPPTCSADREDADEPGLLGPQKKRNLTGILPPARKAQLFGVKARGFRLGWEGEKNDIW